MAAPHPKLPDSWRPIASRRSYERQAAQSSSRSSPTQVTMHPIRAFTHDASAVYDAYAYGFSYGAPHSDTVGAVVEPSSPAISWTPAT